MYKEMIKAC